MPAATRRQARTSLDCSFKRATGPVDPAQTPLCRSANRDHMRYQFDDFVLDFDRRELAHGSKTIEMGPQVFDLLLHLVRNREHVVTKDNLIEVVWGGRIVRNPL